MGLRAASAAMGAALFLTGMASVAHAAPITPPSDFVSVADNTPPIPFSVPTPHKTYSFDNKGQWGVKFDLDQPVNRDTQWKDVTAGAYFRITPRLKLGGSVGLGDKLAQPQQITPQDLGPRVHLETKFQF